MSEFGGNEGIIQPDIGDPGLPVDAAAAGIGHPSTEDRAVDRRGVRDAAMVVRRAGILHGKGIPGEVTVDPDTGERTVTPYDEIRARDDLVNGKNDPHF